MEHRQTAVRDLFVGARLRARLGLAVASGLMCLLIAATATASAAAPAYTITQLHWVVKIGAPQESCTIVGEMYKPADASALHPVPAILTTNGFNGSYADQEGLAATFASNGYAVLTYSGLGFGGSSCQITLDNPGYDGEAASQLVSFLGGSFAATDGTKINYVIHDSTDHTGHHDSDDPRVGMIGGSYGGEIQYAAADVDPRIDTLIPLITWNNLAYSLAPNNAPAQDQVGETSGVAKYEWDDLFTYEGIYDGVYNIAADPSRDIPCPNFDSRMCTAMLALNSTGNFDNSSITWANQSSVASYVHNIKVPVMMLQGEDDTLFNLHESVATYDALRAQKTPVKLVWQSWGHSEGVPAPGEWSGTMLNSDNSWTVEGKLVEQWFDHYLKGVAATPALNFSYYQPWMYQPNAADGVKDYASLPSYPATTSQQLYLSGSQSLVSSAAAVAGGIATFLEPPLGSPTSTTEISATSQNVPLVDTPGTYASYESAPLTSAENVVGIPIVKLQIADSLQDGADQLNSDNGLVLYFKVEDVSPSGAVTLPDRAIAPARFQNLSGPVTVSLPGIVHQFPAGDRIRLMVTAGDTAYKSSGVPSTVVIGTDSATPGVLTLPVVGAGQATPLTFASVPALAKPKIATRGKAVIRAGRLSLKLACTGMGTCTGRVILRSAKRTLLNVPYRALRAGRSETATFTLSKAVAEKLATGVKGTLTVSSPGRTLVQRKEYRATPIKRRR